MSNNNQNNNQNSNSNNCQNSYQDSPLKKFLISLRRKAAQFDQHPFRRAQKYIGTAQGFLIPQKSNPAIGHLAHIIPQVLLVNPCIKGDTAG